MQQRTMQLTSCKKAYTYDQDKALSPEETVERFLERLAAMDLHILEEVRRIDNGRLDIPVFFSVCGRDALEIIGTKKQMGKGSTPAQSRASACMELAERFSFFSFLRNPENFVTGDYQSMEEAGYPVLPPEVLLQSVHDESLSPETLRHLLAGLPIQWTWATHLAGRRAVLVPFSWFYAINEFNGPSAGNTLEEAVLQGISEIVERHVCALVNQQKLPAPAIDQATVTDPVARRLLKAFTDNDITLHLHDFSLNTGMPTIAALAWDPSTFPKDSEIVFTAGTTPSPTKALIRALTEVAQLAGDFNSGSNYVASGLPKPRDLDEVAYLLDTADTVSLDDMADISDLDMLEEVHNSLAALSRIGMEVYAVDTMHPELRIPALYTIIPGAHFRERASGGNAALFAAKLASELLQGDALDHKLEAMQHALPQAYFISFYRGRHLYEQGRFEQALSWFERALLAAPPPEDLPYLYSYCGCCLRDLGEYRQAVVALEKGLSCDEERPDLHNALGVCNYKLGDHGRAAQHFQRAVELNPVSAIDYANLALNLELLGRIDEAAAQYQIALAQDPGIEFAAERLANLLNGSL